MANRSMNGVDTKPWSHAVTRVLAFAEQKSARIVGVTGNTPGVGVSLLSRELARAYAASGMAVVLVDASRVAMDSIKHAEGRNVPFDLLAMATRDETGLLFVDLAAPDVPVPSDRLAIKEAFERAAASDVAVVVDLPAVYPERIQDSQMLGHIGSACQLAFLVCMSGVITKAEVTDCVGMCRINRVPVGGIVINDWKQPAAWLAAGW